MARQAGLAFIAVARHPAVLVVHLPALVAGQAGERLEAAAARMTVAAGVPDPPVGSREDGEEQLVVLAEIGAREIRGVVALLAVAREAELHVARLRPDVVRLVARHALDRRR